MDPVKYLLLIGFIFPSKVFSIEVMEVKILNSYSITKEFPGKLLPIEQSKLAFEIPGKIKKINVDVGDSVNEGEILAKLDDREALAQVNQAKASYDLSKQVLERFEDLRKQGHISVQDLDKAKSDFIIAKSQQIVDKSHVQDLKKAPQKGGLIIGGAGYIVGSLA